MMTATECPPTDRLKDLKLGRLPEDESDLLLNHLHTCQGCQSELETIGDGEDSLIHAIRSPDHADGLSSEPECQIAMIAALGAIGASTQSPTKSGIPEFPVSIGEYDVVRPLGRGGMGNVYLARHTKLGRMVAIKVLAHHRLADAKMKERFEAEMRAVGRLSHPGIVTAHDAREIDGTAVLVTEFVDGMDLAELVSRTGAIAIADACELVRQVAVALQYTGDQGFVHRDVKPSNIMLASSGEVKLLDLGLARLQEPVHDASELTGTGQAMGTADYIAPEQVTDSRCVDVHADIYALGCTLFKLLTGTAPFAGPEHATAFAKMTAHVSSPPPSLSDFLPDAPAGLVKLVASMLAKDPKSRPQSAMQVAEKLSPFAKDANLSELIRHAETLAPGQATNGQSMVRSKPNVQPWFRRPVPVTAAIAAGVFGLFIGLMGGFLIRIKAPDGSVVTMTAPQGSEISITPNATEDSTEPTPDPAPTNSSDEPFLKFAILATSEESKQHVAKFGGQVTGGPGIHSMRWYPMDLDLTSGRNHEKIGQAYQLVRDGDSITFANDQLREQIEFAQTASNGGIELRLSESAGNAMRELTRKHMKRKLAVIVNGTIRMAPTIQSEVGRDIMITGNFTKEEIKFLMDSLNSGLVQPLSKPAAPAPPVESKSDIERLQGVWRIVSDNRLVSFDGNKVYLVDDQSIQAAGLITDMTLGNVESKELMIQNLLSSGRPKGITKFRFLSDEKVEFGWIQLSGENSALDSNLGPTTELAVGEYLGKVPSNMQQLSTLLTTPKVLTIEPESRGKLLQALILTMEVEQMGVEAFAKKHEESRAAQGSVDSINQLKHMAIGFHNFHAAYRKFPASASTTREGSLALNDPSELQPFSWRVAILPFIEEQKLFEQYRFDEPWDSEANSQLLSRMPELYRSPTAPADQPVGNANYQGFADGTGAIGIEDGYRMQDMLDGTSDTLLIMETESSVPWTKPQDLSGLPEFADDVVLRYALVDGSVRTMDPIDIDKLKALITRDGGERVQP